MMDGPTNRRTRSPVLDNSRQPGLNSVRKHPASPRYRTAVIALRRIATASLPALLMRVGTLVISVVSVRMVAPFLGKDELGTYAALQTVAAWTALVTLGLPEACSGILAKFHHVRNYRSAERYLRTSHKIIFLVAGGTIVCGVMAFGVLSWLGEIEPWKAFPVLVAATLSLMTMPFVLAQASLNADGEIGRSTAWNFGIATLGLAAIWWITSSSLFTSHRLLATCAAVGSANLFSRCGMYFLETRRRYGRASHGHRLSGRATGTLLKSSYPFVVLSLAALAAFQVDRVIAYHFLSPEDTAKLDVTLKIVLAAYGVYAVVVAKLWNSVGRVWNEGDRRAARGVLLKSLAAALGFWTAVGVVIGVCITPIVNFATHGTITSLDSGLVTAVVAYIACRALVDSVTISIYAIRRQHETIGTAIAHGLLNIPLSIAGCMAFGLVGIIYGQLAALLFTSGWRFPLIFLRATTVRT